MMSNDVKNGVKHVFSDKFDLHGFCWSPGDPESCQHVLSRLLKSHFKYYDELNFACFKNFQDKA